MYFCPKCKKPISENVRALIRHLRQVHAISDGQDFTLVCFQNHCQRTYHNFNSYAKHLNRAHRVANPEHAEHLDSVNESSVLDETGISSNQNTAESGQSDGEMDTPIDPLFDNHERAASFVAKMYSASNSTLTDVQKSVLCTQELMENTLNFSSVKQHLCLMATLYQMMTLVSSL